MATDYIQEHQHLEERLVELAHELPGPMGGFARLHKKAMDDSALSLRVKEMRALAISIMIRCEGCITYHSSAVVRAGATRQELLETLRVAILRVVGQLRSVLFTHWTPANSFCSKARPAVSECVK